MDDMIAHPQGKATDSLSTSIPLNANCDTDKPAKNVGDWYVIQVPTGREEAMCQIIQRVAGEDILKECFTPRFATEKKIKGQWVPAESLLLPGYVIAVTNDAVALYERLTVSSCPERRFARWIGMIGRGLAPLPEKGIAWFP